MPPRDPISALENQLALYLIIFLSIALAAGTWYLLRTRRRLRLGQLLAAEPCPRCPGSDAVTAAMVLDLTAAHPTPDPAVISLDSSGHLRIEPQAQARANGRQQITATTTAIAWNDGAPLTQADAHRYAAVLNHHLGQPARQQPPGQPGPTTKRSAP